MLSFLFSKRKYAVIFSWSWTVWSVKCVSLHRDRSSAEECLKHPWLTQSQVQGPGVRVKGASEEPNTLHQGDSGLDAGSDPEKPETEEPVVTEELIVVTSYTLGQCRQSEKEKMEQKAISKRFKFEEPLLQEIPGEFIYWAVLPFRTLRFLHWKCCYLWTFDQTVHNLMKVDGWPGITGDKNCQTCGVKWIQPDF